MKNKITVSIAGQEYTMVAAEGEDYVRRVAAHVDSQMREVLSQGRLSQADGAVLAAMNIADQYFKSRRPPKTCAARSRSCWRSPLS